MVKDLTMNKQTQSLDASDQVSAAVQDFMGMRITNAFIRTLWLFVENSREKYCGADVMRELKLQSGTVYPLLTRMVNIGWLSCEKEEVNPREVGRPAKRFYQITPVGLKEGRKLLTQQFPGWNYGKPEFV